MKDISPEKALGKAKLRLMLSAGKFISAVCIQLEHVIGDEVPTAATNGKRVIYNPEFFMELTPEERVALIAHECWHVAFMHMFRIGDRHPIVWNYAGDYVINLELRKDNFKLPEPHLFDPKYDNMTTEQIYDLIMDELDGDEPDPDNLMLDIQAPDTGDSEQEDGGQSAAAKQAEQAVTEILVKAVTQARMEQAAGSIPAEIGRAIDDLINPKLDWRELLERFVSEAAKDDYSWKRPNKRYFPNTYLPSAYSERLGHICVAIDTSGSVSDEMLREMLSEIKGIWDMFAPQKMTIIDCDYVIHNVYEIEDGEEILDCQFSGGGGTSFHPVIDYCKEHETELLIYFTDLWATQIEEELPWETLWICYSNHEPAPIGQTVYTEYGVHQ